MGLPPRSTGRSVADWPAARCMSLPPRRPCISGLRVDLRLALAARASGDRRQVLWIATDFAAGEGGGPYGPGLDLFGLASARLLVLRVPKPVDVLWAMEEALRCRALACVIAELTGDGCVADLTATRRLALAAREGISAQNSGFGLLIRHRTTSMPSAAATRWEIAPELSRPDAIGERLAARPRAFRSFSSQEPARPVRPLDHRVGSS